MSASCLVIGIDALDPDYFQANRKQLPTLDRLARDGSWGRLRSTFPPVTGPAWTSAFTGVNPGVHGITSFVAYDVDMRRNVFDARDIQVPRVWNLLSHLGLRVAVIGVPLTWPVEEINGVMVSGFMTPDGATRWAYPLKWQEQLDAAGYIPDLGFDLHAPPEPYLATLHETATTKYELTQEILASEHWDCFIVVVSESDWIQHFLARPPGHPEREGNELRLLEYFQLLDRYIARWLRAAGDDVAVLLASDHGFGHFVRRRVSVNRFLVDQGYAVPKAGSKGRLDRIRRLAGRPGARTGTLEVDPTRSRATFRQYFWCAGAVSIGAATHPRDRESVVEELVETLRALTDPVRGTRLFAAVEPRRTWLWGPFAEQEPEILCLLAEGYGATDYIEAALVTPLPPEASPYAAHRTEGIWVLSRPAGSKAKPGLSRVSPLESVCNSVLSLLGLPSDALAASSTSAASTDPTSAPGPHRLGNRRFVEDALDEERTTHALLRRLRALGYVDEEQT